MPLSSRTRFFSCFILVEILRKVNARSSAPVVVVVGAVTSATASSAPLHGESQRVDDVMTAGAVVTGLSRHTTVEMRSNAAAAATSTQCTVV